MATETLEERSLVAASYQQQLQALAFEIRVAMKAIASNSLQSLEASVAKQEILCAALLKLAGRLEGELRSTESRRPFPNSPVEQRVISTTKAVQDLNSQYASLLRHSGRSIALLSSLCRSHSGQFPEVHRTPVKRQTWSCEM